MLGLGTLSGSKGVALVAYGNAGELAVTYRDEDEYVSAQRRPCTEQRPTQCGVARREARQIVPHRQPKSELGVYVRAEAAAFIDIWNAVGGKISCLTREDCRPSELCAQL